LTKMSFCTQYPPLFLVLFYQDPFPMVCPNFVPGPNHVDIFPAPLGASPLPRFGARQTPKFKNEPRGWRPGHFPHPRLAGDDEKTPDLGFSLVQSGVPLARIPPTVGFLICRAKKLHSLHHFFSAKPPFFFFEWPAGLSSGGPFFVPVPGRVANSVPNRTGFFSL